jgi:hypothetical protein
MPSHLWLRCKCSCAGDVFLTLADLLKLNPEFAPLRELYTKAGLEDEVLNMQGEHNSLTVFAPTGMFAVLMLFKYDERQ